MKKRLLAITLLLTMVLSCMGGISAMAEETALWDVNFDNVGATGNGSWGYGSAVTTIQDDGVSVFSAGGSSGADTSDSAPEGYANWWEYYAAHGEIVDFIVENEALKIFTTSALENNLWISPQKSVTATNGEFVFSFSVNPVDPDFTLRCQVFAGSSYLNYFDFEEGNTIKLLGTDVKSKINIGKWNNIAFVSNGTSMKAYINGEHISTLASGVTNGIDKIQLSINHYKGKDSEFYLDDIKLIQTNDETTALYNNSDAIFVMNAVSSNENIVVDNENIDVVIDEALTVGKLTEAINAGTNTAATVSVIGATGAVVSDGSTLAKDAKYVKLATAYNSKIYDIKVKKDVILDDGIYTVDKNENTVSGVVSGTKVSEFINAFTFIEGSSASVLNGSTVLGNDAAVDEGMTLRISNDSDDYDYAINRKYYLNEDFTASEFTSISNRPYYWAVSDKATYPSGFAYSSNNSKLFDNFTESFYKNGERIYGVWGLSGSNVTYTPNEKATNTWYNMPNSILNPTISYEHFWYELNKPVPDVSVVASYDRYFYPTNPEAGGEENGRQEAAGAHAIEFNFCEFSDIINSVYNYKFEVIGCTDEGKETQLFMYDGTKVDESGRTTYLLGQTTTTDVTHSGTASAFKIVEYGNGYADAYMDGTKIVDGLKFGAGDIDFLRFKVTTTPNKMARFWLDDVKVYPVAYTDGETIIGDIELYAGSDEVTTLSGLTLDSGNYDAKVSVNVQSVNDINASLIAAAYKGDVLQGVAIGTQTAVLKGENKDITVSIDAAKLNGADRVQVFLWSLDKLIPLKAQLDIDN